MFAKILVVDDEPDLEHLVRQKFRRQIRNNEFEFLFAQNGVQALDYLQHDNAIDLVLTDINMPEMDGLTLLDRIKELKMPLLRSVIVSAYGDMENIRIAMNRGAYDFVVKPIDLADLEITINKSLDDLFKLKEAIQSHDQLIALHHELDIARTIQMSLLPKTFPAFPDRHELDIYAEMTPAKEVGGDFYDYFLIDKNRLGFAIGDVSGKGVPAALFMAVCKTVLKTTALKGLSPDECLQQVNRMLQLESIATLFVSVFYGILDISTGEVIYCNGGHLPPYKISKTGQAIALEITGDIVLGVYADALYKTKTTRLDPGDGLVLYTDGVTEAMTPDNEEYGEERLKNCLQFPHKNAKETIHLLIDAVNTFASGRAQSDDMTILTLCRL